jgi:hypothetical protein
MDMQIVENQNQCGAINVPFILIQYDPETRTPMAVFPNGRTAEETRKLTDLASRMIEAVMDEGLDSQERPGI